MSESCSVPKAVTKVANAIKKHGKYKGNTVYFPSNFQACPLAREFGHGMGLAGWGENDTYSYKDTKAKAVEVGLTERDCREFIDWFDNSEGGQIKTLKKLLGKGA